MGVQQGSRWGRRGPGWSRKRGEGWAAAEGNKDRGDSCWEVSGVQVGTGGVGGGAGGGGRRRQGRPRPHVARGTRRPYKETAGGGGTGRERDSNPRRWVCAVRERRGMELNMELPTEPPAAWDNRTAWDALPGAGGNETGPPRAKNATSILIAIVITALYSVVCVVGLLGNVLVMYGIVR